LGRPESSPLLFGGSTRVLGSGKNGDADEGGEDVVVVGVVAIELELEEADVEDDDDAGL